MKIALRTHDLGVRGLDAAVARLKECSIDAVQLVAYKFMDEIKYEAGRLNHDNAALIGETLAAAGITVGLVGAYFNPVHSNAEKVLRGKQVFKEYLKYCKTLGCDTVGSETGSFNDDKWTYNPLNRTDGALETVVSTFSELAAYAKSVGAYVGMEGAAGHVCWNVATLKRAQDAIAADNIKIIFDIYNYLDGSNYNDYLSILDEGLETFAGRITVFHIKDCVFSDGKLKQVAPGKGMFDFKKILGKIKSYDKDAFLVLEGTTGEDIVPCANFIRRVWDEIN